MHSKPYAAALLCLLFTLTCASAGAISLDDVMDAADSYMAPDSKAGSSSGLAQSDIVSGLKQALDVAVDRSVDYLGQPGGYLDDPKVRIPMPDHLSRARTLASAVGREDLVDDFVSSMNSAAEQAAPQTVDIFAKAIKAMTFEDAKGILDGPDDAATAYFQRSSTEELTALIRPIVSESMQSVGVTRSYKQLTSGVAAVGNMLDQGWFDLDGYVTEKAVAGLFTVMAREEKSIREDPLARTTDLLKKVFGSGHE